MRHPKTSEIVLILSQSSDQSTSDVIDWLLSYGKKIFRINEYDRITECCLDINCSDSESVIRVKNNFINIYNIHAFWFRRGRLHLSFYSPEKVSMILGNNYIKYFENECTTLEYFIAYKIYNNNNCITLGTYLQGNANKLISLYIAEQIGLLVPSTIISSLKDKLLDFSSKHEACISKDIQDTLSVQKEKNMYYTMTSKLDNYELNEMYDNFFPSLLQCEITKRYELRIFYLKGKCYSMAIFSQEDEQTSIDFRNYNTKKPNRYVPYNLPLNVSKKLDLFMRKMNLDTGSIDMIVTPSLEYIFLEVNPVGQYDMVSVPCNYYLHKEIAKTLSNDEQK